MRKHRLTLRILPAICGRLIFFQKPIQPRVNENSFTAIPIFSSRIPTSHAAGKNPLPPRPRVLHTRSTHLYQEKKPTAQQRQMNRLLAIREPTKWIDHGGYVTSRRPAPRPIAKWKFVTTLILTLRYSYYNLYLHRVASQERTLHGNRQSGYGIPFAAPACCCMTCIMLRSLLTQHQVLFCAALFQFHTTGIWHACENVYTDVRARDRVSIWGVKARPD